MIRSEDVFNITLGLLKKDARGQGFGQDEFNHISSLVNMELYNAYVAKYETDAIVSKIMAPFKVRNATLMLTSGVAKLPGVYDRLAGNPTIAYPWGSITATASVTIVNNANAKLKITSPRHNLKNGDVISATGLSVHNVTSKEVRVIDRDSFWVDVNWTGVDVLTNAAWTMATAERKEVDMITELEYSARVGDSNLKPTIANPVSVLDSNVSAFISAFASGGAGLVSATSTAHGLITGMTVTIASSTVSAYNGTYVVTVTGVNTFTFAGTYTATGTATWTCYELTQITVYPATLTSINVNYLKLPPVPFLDYYVNSTGLIVFMAEGAKQVNIPTGAEYRTGIVGGAAVYVDSATVNWGWDKSVLPHIIYTILSKAGLNMQDMNTINLAIAEEAKEEARV